MDKLKVINKFFGGITRDDKARIQGVASNVEEIDIFSNADYIQAEQIFSADTLPEGTEAYAHTSGSDGKAYAYGKETAASKVRLLSLTAGGSDNPGDWTTLFTSDDTTNLAYSVSPIQYMKTTEANSNYLYYCTKTATTTVVLKRFCIDTSAESTVGTLTQLNGSYDRIAFRMIFGELYITNGKFMSKVDSEGGFTEAAYTLPNEWTAVDICPVSDVSVIIARYIDRTVNFSKGFWWDLTSSVQFDDSFDLPAGGPQWIVNHKETIKLLCASNGYARFFQMSGAFAGAVPVELPGMVLTNVQTDGATQPVSPSKSVAVKDKILYFGLNKSDKSGVYALGQLDSDKPTALVLSKRFNTTSYATHTPTSLMIQGPNFYAAYGDNGTASVARCESVTASRSSSGIYETIVIDDDNPLANKNINGIYITTQPLPASTDVNTSISTDYGSYSEIFRADGSSLNTTGAVLGFFLPKRSGIKVFKTKLQLVSSGTNSPKVTSIGMALHIDKAPASK